LIAAVDHIDCRLSNHYPLDAIFLILPKTDAGRAIGLALSQRPSDWVMIISPYREVHEVLIARRLLPLSLPHRTSGRFRFPPFMLVHFGLGGRQVAQASERECALWLTQRCFLRPSLPLPQPY
jgi:hypothetical protein